MRENFLKSEHLQTLRSYLKIHLQSDSSESVPGGAPIEVGGHGARFCEYLLQRPDWHVFPHQKWFQDEVKGDQSPPAEPLVQYRELD